MNLAKSVAFILCCRYGKRSKYKAYLLLRCELINGGVMDLAGVDLLDGMMKMMNCIKKQVYGSLLIYMRANTYSVERM